jgi:uncharacterized protein YndB with AHSA1/START domain
MPERTAQPATFTIDRHFAHPPARVFAAFADETAKASWFVGPTDESTNETAGESTGESAFDFREGGRETAGGPIPDGRISRFESHYWDIVPNERIIYSYDMHLDDRRISVSLATLEFRPAAGGIATDLRLTEQAVFLDGLDIVADRERGTRELLDALDRYLGESVEVSA